LLRIDPYCQATHQHADTRSPVYALAAGAKGFDDDHPERSGRDEQRCQSARHPLLGPHDGEVADADHEKSDEREIEQRVAVARQTLTAPDRDRGHHDTSHDETDRRQRERWNRLDGDTDRQIRRTPDETDRDECGDGEGALVFHDGSPRRIPPTFSQ
jgi:hypothetical protein